MCELIASESNYNYICVGPQITCFLYICMYNCVVAEMLLNQHLHLEIDDATNYLQEPED